MADTYTDFLNLVQPEVGGSRDSWGTKDNANLALIDAWAKRVDAQAVDALARRLAPGADVTTPQVVAGPVSFSKGVSAPSGSTSTLGDVLAARADGTGLIALGNTTRGLQWTGTEYRMPGGELFVAGYKAWHAGNLAPEGLADKAATVLQKFAANLQVFKDRPGVELVDNQGRGDWRLWVGNAGNLNWTSNSGSNPEAIVQVGRDGSIYSKQFGDLNARIEARAKAYADSAGGYTDARVNELGNTRLLATALQGRWEAPTPPNAWTNGPAIGVMQGVLVNGASQIIGIGGRYLYQYRGDLGGWVGAYSI